MSRVIASAVLLLGFPALFVAAAAGFEFVLHSMQPDVTPLYVSTEQSRPLSVALAIAFLPIAFAFYDVCDVNGLTSSYRGGVEGCLPTDHPAGYLLLRLRRYTLVLVVTTAAFMAFYCFNVLTDWDLASRPHKWAALGAFFMARRPLNFSPGDAFVAFSNKSADGMEAFARSSAGNR